MSGNTLYIIGGLIQCIGLLRGATYTAIGINVMFIGIFTVIRGLRG